jgi:putative membrane protein
VVDNDFQPEERLHPMSWLFGLVTFIRQFLFPIVAAVIFGSKDGMPWWLSMAFVPMLVAALWKQHFYRYGLGPSGLVIREGVLFHNIRQIDYTRIENLDTERGPLHRLLGVTEIRVETSTGGKPEALIQVLSLQAAEALREHIFASRVGRSDRAVEVEQEDLLLHLPLREVVKFGLIDNRGMVVVAGIFGLLYESGIVQFAGEMIKARLSEQIVIDLLARGLILQAALGIGLLLLALLLVRAFSVALALVTLYDFKLARVGMDLRARYGLLTRVALTLRLPRIQAVHQTENLLHRLFARVSLRVDLAGDGASAEQSDEARSKVRWLAPIVTPDAAARLIAIALPHNDFESQPKWESLASGARRRVFRKSAAWCVALALIVGFTLNPNAAVLIVLASIPLTWWYAVMYVRYTRWALQPDMLLFQSGWLTRKLVIVPRDRIQSVRTVRSPFDRRHAMASIVVDTAGAGPRSDEVRISYLDESVVASLARALYVSASIRYPAAAGNDDRARELGTV